MGTLQEQMRGLDGVTSAALPGLDVQIHPIPGAV